jgi:hypothetical protein
MYIRWKMKPRTKKTYERDEQGQWSEQHKTHAMLLSAYLAENKRVDGKPRQTVIYLASIQDTQIAQVEHRRKFWEAVEKKLFSLKLSVDQQSMIIDKLEKRVSIGGSEQSYVPPARTATRKSPKKDTQQVKLVALWEFAGEHGVAVDDVRRNINMGDLHPIKQGDILMLDAEGQRAFWELNHDYHKGWWKDCSDCPHRIV